MSLGDSSTTGPEEMRNAYDFMMLAEYEDSGLNLALVDRSAPSWALGLLHDDGFELELTVLWRE